MIESKIIELGFNISFDYNGAGLGFYRKKDKLSLSIFTKLNSKYKIILLKGAKEIGRSEVLSEFEVIKLIQKSNAIH